MIVFFKSADSAKIPALGFNCVSTIIKCHLSVFGNNLVKNLRALNICTLLLHVCQPEFHDAEATTAMPV